MTHERGGLWLVNGDEMIVRPCQDLVGRVRRSIREVGLDQAAKPRTFVAGAAEQ
jgi:hypothetical protein